MYSDNKFLGEHSSVAEELLSTIPDLEQKCRAVEKSVAEGYFGLEDALKIYGVIELEYLSYLMLKHIPELNQAQKQDQFLETITAVVSLFNAESRNFDPARKKLMQTLKDFIEAQPIKNRLLVNIS